nr:uncharacterized protein LOC109157637 [Ipomoea trifida]
MEKKDADSVMPIIGLYVAAASALCFIAMLLNLVNNLSGKFFSLNATWLTILAVATKLTGDLTTPMFPGDNLSKGNSTVLLTLAMGNFFTSLGSMSDTYILTNLTALSILVTTVLVNLCIQLRTRVLDSTVSLETTLEIALLFCAWITILCSALALPAIKKRTESKYQKLAASDEKQMERHTVEELRLSITKYWVMAASGSPPSLMKRLVTFIFTNIICVFSSLIIYLGIGHRYEYENCLLESDYKWSMEAIIITQGLAKFFLSIVIIIFLIRVLGYKYEDNGIKIIREEFAIESFWTEKLVEWRQGSIPMSNQVPRLLSGEPPNCWTLPVVTLTSIAIAIPNIASEHVDWLVSSVNEGLRYASLIDVLGEKRGLKSIKNAADVVWVGVELHRKWIDMDLERKIGDTSSTKDIIQDLADVAERIVMEFSSKDNIILVENPLYWPSNVLAANSMYRITRTIMLYYENNEYQAEELFRKLICMIADILAACLTNLPHMITTKCISNAIEERLESVRDGAIIFGETEDILKFFEEHKLSSVVPSQPLCIDEWCGWIEQQATTVSSSTTSNGASS